MDFSANTAPTTTLSTASTMSPPMVRRPWVSSVRPISPYQAPSTSASAATGLSAQNTAQSKGTGAQSQPTSTTITKPMMTPMVTSAGILRASSAPFVRNPWIRSMRPVPQPAQYQARMANRRSSFAAGAKTKGSLCQALPPAPQAMPQTSTPTPLGHLNKADPPHASFQQLSLSHPASAAVTPRFSLGSSGGLACRGPTSPWPATVSSPASAAVTPRYSLGSSGGLACRSPTSPWPATVSSPASAAVTPRYSLGSSGGLAWRSPTSPWPATVSSPASAAVTPRSSLGSSGGLACRSPTSPWPATVSSPASAAVTPRYSLGSSGGLACRGPMSSGPATVSSTAPLVDSPRPIQRGTLGEKGECEVNYLPMNLDKMPDIAYQYHVSIEPERPKILMRPVFDTFSETHFKNIAMAFDGKQLAYTVEKLPCKYFKAKVEITDSNSRKFCATVKIQETENLEVDLKFLKTYHSNRLYDKPMRALQCLETVLASPCHRSSVRIGRAFYTKPKDFLDLKDGYEMWIGLFQAPILGDAPYLNVDVANKSFPSSTNLTDHLQKHMGVTSLVAPLDRRSVGKLRTFLKDGKVTYTPPKCFGTLPKNYGFVDVVDCSAANLMFDYQGDMVSVAHYYETRNFRLRYPNLNCLHLGRKENKMYIPLEFCSIEGGQIIRPIDAPRQVQELIRYAATSTDDRKRKIFDLLERFRHNEDLKVQIFGIRLGLNFMRIEMRVLNAPMLEYFGKEEIRPFKGSWRPGKHTHFFETKPPISGIKWALIYDKRSRVQYGQVNELANLLTCAGRGLNLHLGDRPKIIAFTDLEATIKGLKQEEYELAVAVIPTLGVSYAQIKQGAELRHGLLTQCIKEETLKRRCNMQMANNLVLKLNAKLNGINHKLGGRACSFEAKGVMFMGGDVTHPTPDQRRMPSVVGVVGSHDPYGTCYNMQFRLQSSASELINDMESIATYHLKMYEKYQGKYPAHIIYYRDGVSDGEIAALKKKELGAIRAALSKLKATATITCILVVKRHHTRFFPTVRNPRDKFNNVKPGTVVDHKIVHPAEQEFYMVSHEALQGTAKPTRYHVVEDDMKFKIDYLQSLTYHFCHLFPRCNRSVSYPAPAYLAHLAAARGKVYIDGPREMQYNRLQDEYSHREISGALMEHNPMYFV